LPLQKPGAILDAVDKRIAAFVFMGGPQSNRQYVLFSDSPRMVSARKGMDLTKVEQTRQLISSCRRI